MMKTKEKKSKNKSNENFSKFISLFGYPRTRVPINKMIHSAISLNCYAQKTNNQKTNKIAKKIYTMTDGSPMSKLTGGKWLRRRLQFRIIIRLFIPCLQIALNWKSVLEESPRSRGISSVQTSASVIHLICKCKKSSYASIKETWFSGSKFKICEWKYSDQVKNVHEQILHLAPETMHHCQD